MLIQRRPQTARYITQHEHGLHVGSLAHGWSVNFGSEAIMAMSLHDLAWQPVDDITQRAFLFDHVNGRLRDFTGAGLAKLDMYVRGLDLLEKIHPYAALLTSMHYALFFPENDQTTSFLTHERARRAQLTQLLEVEPAHVRRDYDWLQFFDGLSLFACLHAPGTDFHHHLSWLPNEMSSPTGTHHLEWVSDHVLAISGVEPDLHIKHTIHYRELPLRFDHLDAFVEKWTQSTVHSWDLTICAK